MPEAFVGSLSDRPEWKVSIGSFVDNLLEKWPDTRITIQKDYKNLPVEEGIIAQFNLEWSIKGEELGVFCSFDQTHLMLEGCEELYPTIAVWFRRLLPPDYPIYLWYETDKGQGYEIPFTLTVKELEEIMGFNNF